MAYRNHPVGQISVLRHLHGAKDSETNMTPATTITKHMTGMENYWKKNYLENYIMSRLPSPNASQGTQHCLLENPYADPEMHGNACSTSCCLLSLLLAYYLKCNMTHICFLFYLLPVRIKHLQFRRNG